MRIAVIALLLALGGAACGQRGELFLRENPPPGYKPPSEVYEPVPYPDEVLSGREGQQR